jgi:outer membrane lipoprotein-sorting protein
MRLFFMALAAVLLLSGCTAKEFNQGVEDGVNDIKQVIRGEKN